MIHRHVITRGALRPFNGWPTQPEESRDFAGNEGGATRTAIDESGHFGRRLARKYRRPRIIFDKESVPPSGNISSCVVSSVCTMNSRLPSRIIRSLYPSPQSYLPT